VLLQLRGESLDGSGRNANILQKLTVSELKQLVERPEVVEWFDCDARDPRLLVSLKSYRKYVHGLSLAIEKELIDQQYCPRPCALECET